MSNTPWTEQEVTECEDCHAWVEEEVYHYDDGEGCHEVCRSCAIKRGFKVTPANSD